MLLIHVIFFIHHLPYSIIHISINMSDCASIGLTDRGALNLVLCLVPRTGLIAMLASRQESWRIGLKAPGTLSSLGSMMMVNPDNGLWHKRSFSGAS